MGGCCCCCAGAVADRSDPAVTAHILTDEYVCYRGSFIRTRYILPGYPKAVYVRDDKLYYDCCAGCVGGYPLRSITSAEAVSGVTVNLPQNGRYSSFYLNPGVKIVGADGTIIAFSGAQGEVERFVDQLKESIESCRQKLAPKPAEIAQPQQSSKQPEKLTDY